MNHLLQHRWYRRFGWLLGLLLGLAIALFPHVPTVANPSDSPLQQARTLYQSGQYQPAATLFEQVLQTQTAQPLNRALTLSSLALVYQNLGKLEQARTAIAQSVALFSPTGGQENERRVRAQVLNTQGRLQLTWGQAEAALESWQRAEQDYRALKDDAGVIGSQTNQVQALRSLGFYRRAQEQIESVKTILANQPDSLLKAASFRTLGDILRVVGNLNAAKTELETSLRLAQELRSPQDIASALLSLGAVEQALGRQQSNLGAASPGDNRGIPLDCPIPNPSATATSHYQTALNYYQQSAAQAVIKTTQIQAQLNQLRLQIELGQSPEATRIQSLQNQLDELAPSRTKIYAQVNFARSLVCLRPQSSGTTASDMSLKVLQAAAQQAAALSDLRAQSYALGNLGQLYEAAGNLSAAQQETILALNLAQQIGADDVAYQWQWQLGRILSQQGDRPQSLKYYNAAFAQLQRLRSDLIALNADVQFSFRESVEPIYRQYVDLLLRSPSQPDLIQARSVIEALQLAELDNFFRDACSDAIPTLIDQLTDLQDPAAAVIYPIILENRLDIILKLPRQSNLLHTSIAQSAVQVETVVNRLRQQLQEPFTIQTVQQPAQEVYRWLIQPYESALAAANVKTLVFVLDGALRNVPMAALYDGDRYLVEKYAIAITPGLQLINPRPIQQVQVNALAGGLSIARQEFAALPNVVTELATIKTIVPTRIELLNDTFTETNIERAIQTVPVSIVHFATHGRFSSQAEDTFILAYDGRVNVNELETLLRNREQPRREDLELLVLSACETATGDERAALGLAGVAVRAGARSTLASLWKADDEATAQLISEFYRKLYKSDLPVNKAIALQEAQQLILNNPSYRHPRYWAPFVLLGNWL